MRFSGAADAAHSIALSSGGASLPLRTPAKIHSRYAAPVAGTGSGLNLKFGVVIVSLFLFLGMAAGGVHERLEE
jgi:hypothetical protein